MEEKNQQETTMQQVTTKDPKKVEVDKRLAARNHKQRERLKAQKSEVISNQYYGIGAVLNVGVIGGLGYLYQAKVNIVPPQQPRPQSNKFEME